MSDEICKACSLGIGAHIETCARAAQAPMPWWIPSDKYGGEALDAKTYGRIWVRTEEDKTKVVAIIEEMDPFEFSYMGKTSGPDCFVGVWPEDPTEAKLVYGHKFELRTDTLRFICWQQGIEIWVVTGHRRDY